MTLLRFFLSLHVFIDKTMHIHKLSEFISVPPLGLDGKD